MKPVFADTFFFFAILNRADPLHQRAAAFSRNNRQLRVTTDWVNHDGRRTLTSP